MSKLEQFPNLRDRAHQFLTENGGFATDADLIRHIFRGQGTGWAAFLDAILGKDERIERTLTGWQLRDSAPKIGEQGRYVSLFTLATGPKPPRARLLVFGAAAFVNWRLASTALWVCRPEPPVRLPKGLAEAAIGQDDIAEAPTFETIASEIIEYLGDQPLVSLDTALSVAFLQFELRRAGQPSLGNPLIDLTTLAEARVGARPDLGRLAAHLHLPPPRARNPLRRAIFMGELAAALLKDNAPPVTTPAEHATRQRPLLDPATATLAPDGPGVYLFRDANDRVVYVGKSRSLRRRLLSYCTSNLDKSRNMAGLIALVETVEVRSTLCPLDGGILEARLIAYHRPPFNVQRRTGAQLVYTSVEISGGRPRLRWSREPGDQSYGPLRLTEARQIARTALTNRPPSTGPRQLVRDLRQVWMLESAARLRRLLQEIALPGPLETDDDGIWWLAEGEVEVGLSARGWVASRNIATGELLYANHWPEPPSPATEWAMVLALKRRENHSFAHPHGSL